MGLFLDPLCFKGLYSGGSTVIKISIIALADNYFFSIQCE